MNTTLSSLNWIENPVKTLDSIAMFAASERQQQLTKPAGSLGKLEQVAIRLAGMQGNSLPCAEKVAIAVFAADHGIAAEGVSAFPQAVTAEMVKNFAGGGAAICVAARYIAAPLTVYNLGTVTPTDGLANVVNQPIAPQTANFLQHPAMTPAQLAAAMAVGRLAVCNVMGSVAGHSEFDLTDDKDQIAIQDNDNQRLHLFIGGEMGIANTTSATAIASVLLGCAAEKLTGPGTGLDAAGISHKAKIITQAIEFHRSVFNSSEFEGPELKGSLDDPLIALQYFGGFEIAALTAAYLTCAQEGVPAVVDGFICTVAAMVACRINPRVADWMILSHTSAEPAYDMLLDSFDAMPLLNLELRLGEGSGAAIAVPLIRFACALHNQMATFAEAAVSASTTNESPKKSSKSPQREELV
ncbi:nicotinate-nucleotide--dimethylbenzimidazole phosphoribosyltransferase [Neptunomonas sp.]